jgi:hypothetical protein
MKNRALITLFLLSASLGIFYFYYLAPTMQEKRLLDDFSRRFFYSDPVEIDMIRIENRAGVHVIKHDETSGWRVAEKYKADNGALERLLDVISSARIIKTVGGTEDIDRFGIREPFVNIVLGISGGIETLAIAGENPGGTGHYAYAPNIEKIFLVNKEFVNELQIDLFDLRDKTLYNILPEEVHKVVISRKDDTVELMREGGGWRMISPLSGTGSGPDIEGMLASLARQRATGFVEWREDFSGLPRHTVLELYDRTSGLIDNTDIYFWGSEGNRGILVHRKGSDEAIRVRREFWNLLGSEASSFLERRAFSANADEVASVSVSYPVGKYVFTREGETWHYRGVAVRTAVFRRFLDTILSLKARSLVDEGEFPGKIELTIDVETEQGMERLEVSDFVMDHVASVSRQVVDERGNKVLQKVDFLYARSTDIDYGMVMNSLQIEKVKTLLEEILND